MNAKRAVTTAAMVLLCSSSASAEKDDSLEWVVMNDATKAIVVLPRGQETALGEKNGWRCYGTVREESGAAKHSETLTLWCTDGKVRVQSTADQERGKALNARVSLGISAADGSAPARALAAGVR